MHMQFESALQHALLHISSWRLHGELFMVQVFETGCSRLPYLVYLTVHVMNSPYDCFNSPPTVPTQGLWVMGHVGIDVM